jgi:hypothetical protein
VKYYLSSNSKFSDIDQIYRILKGRKKDKKRKRRAKNDGIKATPPVNSSSGSTSTNPDYAVNNKPADHSEYWANIVKQRGRYDPSIYALNPHQATPPLPAIEAPKETPPYNHIPKKDRDRVHDAEFHRGSKAQPPKEKRKTKIGDHEYEYSLDLQPEVNKVKTFIERQKKQHEQMSAEEKKKFKNSKAAEVMQRLALKLADKRQGSFRKVQEDKKERIKEK